MVERKITREEYERKIKNRNEWIVTLIILLLCSITIIIVKDSIINTYKQSMENASEVIKDAVNVVYNVLPKWIETAKFCNETLHNISTHCKETITKCNEETVYWYNISNEWENLAEKDYG